MYEDRVTSSANFYQRIAQNLQTLEVVQDHPLLGVGFTLYHDTVAGDSKYAVQWGGLDAMDNPHNLASWPFWRKKVALVFSFTSQPNCCLFERCGACASLTF